MQSEHAHILNATQIVSKMKRNVLGLPLDINVCPHYIRSRKETNKARRFLGILIIAGATLQMLFTLARRLRKIVRARAQKVGRRELQPIKAQINRYAT
jgi:hypothetical protein